MAAINEFISPAMKAGIGAVNPLLGLGVHLLDIVLQNNILDDEMRDEALSFAEELAAHHRAGTNIPPERINEIFQKSLESSERILSRAEEARRRIARREAGLDPDTGEPVD